MRFILALITSLDRIIVWFGKHMGFFMLLMFGYVVYASANRPYDPTDDAGAETRSGLYWYVDHGTGCEYIKASWFSELTPRVDSTGYHICEGEDRG